MTTKTNIAYLAAMGLTLGLALLIILINSVVGFIGSDDNPANLMFMGVLAILVIGSLIAHFCPHGMTYALFATALSHALVAVIALLTVEHPSEFRVFLINTFFVAVWAGAALLFRRANDSLNQQRE